MFGSKIKREPQPLQCDICYTWQPFRRFPDARVPRKCREHLSRHNPFKDLTICKECLAHKLEEQILTSSTPEHIGCPICNLEWSRYHILTCLGKDEAGKQKTLIRSH
ncbi:hypothetical protein CERZMDRAFT_96871 [Cercospora zeae-maydis SCOH1-5]|uniref:Uncharacterized protein n=1 Tax=Cercospora zeae-maydis SCOH1-5 TaxID=717836 RepID=A0A6A6FIW0_9PEZI|nr:hypothetical protein CERZMDRAFT_96871 [Cercospora zeae-maydis SCOH1-5]